MFIKNPEFRISAVSPKQYPDDGIQTFYAWDSDEEKYIEGKFEDHVTLTSLPNVYNFRNENTRLYRFSFNYNWSIKLGTYWIF